MPTLEWIGKEKVIKRYKKLWAKRRLNYKKPARLWMLSI